MASQKKYGKVLVFKTPKDRAKRKYIYERDNFACQHCFKRAIRIPDIYDGKNTLRTVDGWLEVDHIIPRYYGGGSHVSNLQTLCNKCKGRKAVSLCQTLNG